MGNGERGSTDRYIPNIKEPQNRLREREHKGAQQADLHERGFRQLLIVAAPPPLIVRLLALPRGLFLQNRRRVRFSRQSHADGPHPGQYEDDPVFPSPAEVLVHETADDSARDRPVEGGETPERHYEAAVLFVRDVDYGAGAVADHDGAEYCAGV